MFIIPKKDTVGRTGSKFVWDCGGHIRVALAVEDTEMLIGGWCTEQGMMRAGRADGLGGVTIQQVRRCVEALNLVVCW
jgi:hypothetical protein